MSKEDKQIDLFDQKQAYDVHHSVQALYIIAEFILFLDCF